MRVESDAHGPEPRPLEVGQRSVRLEERHSDRHVRHGPKREKDADPVETEDSAGDSPITSEVSGDLGRSGEALNSWRRDRAHAHALWPGLSAEGDTDHRLRNFREPGRPPFGVVAVGQVVVDEGLQEPALDARAIDVELTDGP